MASTKFVIVIPDGAADEPFPELGDRTALASGADSGDGWGCRLGDRRPVAERPGPVPAGQRRGDAQPAWATTRTSTTRGGHRSRPRRWASSLGPDDWAIRCNLMTIVDGKLTDFTAGHITSAEGRGLIESIQAALGRPTIEFRPGVSYRNLMIYRGRAGRGAVHGRDRHRPAARSPRCAGVGPLAARAGVRAAQGT